ncbi:hypothetical protein [Methylobacterium sp. 10]|uniref:hypothetical protein n=1 Tax=Methylobacterium sp. 10 TaxID=1101191 RepID=UPI0012DF78D9|nr:hypothetical protein [Methylobacterium sp. 10]
MGVQLQEALAAKPTSSLIGKPARALSAGAVRSLADARIASDNLKERLLEGLFFSGHVTEPIEGPHYTPKRLIAGNLLALFSEDVEHLTKLHPLEFSALARPGPTAYPRRSPGHYQAAMSGPHSRLPAREVTELGGTLKGIGRFSYS